MGSIDNIKTKCISEFMEVMYSIYNNHIHTSNNKLENNFSAIKKNIYSIYPFYFSSHYPKISEKDLYELALCGNLYHTYIMMMDAFIDNEVSNISLLPLQKLNETAIIKLTNLFPLNSTFWNYFNSYREHFSNGMEKEKKIFSGEVDTYSFEDFESITKAKCSVAKCSTAGLLILSKIESVDDPFQSTQDNFHLGLQILDDIQDWEEDYRNKNKSYLLQLVFNDLDFMRKLDQVEDKENTIGKYIFLSNLYTDQLSSALHYFETSKKMCENYNIPYWASFVDNYINYVKQLIQKHTIKRKSVLYHTHATKKVYFNKLEHLDSNFYFSIERGISYLMIERENEYLECNHIMQMPSTEDASSNSSTVMVEGNIFQRTIVLETFFDLNFAFPNVLDIAKLNEDVNKILSFSSKSVKGGWNYFPGYDLLPPDTDDLAQVIQVLVRSKFSGYENYIEENLDLLLNYNMEGDGTCKTWILDPNDDSKLQHKLKIATDNYWGNFRGKDYEVSANLFYSLCIYNKQKYYDIIVRGTSQLISAQLNDGSWDSIWYWGPFYGTYVATRILSQLTQFSSALINSKNFILSTQNIDGGWGLLISDPLSTALAILTLCNLVVIDNKINRKVIASGVEYLFRTQQKNGSWKKVPFIKMTINGKNLEYASETITTAFVLRALSFVTTRYPSLISECN